VHQPSYRENALPAISIKIYHIRLSNPLGQRSFITGSISLHYFEFVSNKYSNVSSVSGPSIAVRPQNNVPAGPPSHRPCKDLLKRMFVASRFDQLGISQTSRVALVQSIFAAYWIFLRVRFTLGNTFIYLFSDNLAAGVNLITAILSCHDKLI